MWCVCLCLFVDVFDYLCVNFVWPVNLFRFLSKFYFTFLILDDQCFEPDFCCFLAAFE